jgi:hypothetical protein
VLSQPSLVTDENSPHRDHLSRSLTRCIAEAPAQTVEQLCIQDAFAKPSMDSIARRRASSFHPLCNEAGNALCLAGRHERFANNPFLAPPGSPGTIRHHRDSGTARLKRHRI